MSRVTVVEGVVIDEVRLSVDELAQACSVNTRWVIERVEAGLLGEPPQGSSVQQWRFASVELARSRRMLQLEQTMDANPEVAALIVDLIDELERLRGRLGAGAPSAH